MKKKTTEAKKYHEWLHTQKCVVCFKCGIEAHHLTHKSLSPRRDDLRMIPLCPEHHRGMRGIHTMGLSWYDAFISLENCIEISRELYNKFLGKYN